MSLYIILILTILTLRIGDCWFSYRRGKENCRYSRRQCFRVLCGINGSF